MRTALYLVVAVSLLAVTACTSHDGGDTATATPTSAIADAATSTATATAVPSTSPSPTVRPEPRRVSPGADYPTVGLRPDGLPVAAEGALVVYVKELRGDSAVEVVIFDLSRGECLSSFYLEANQHSSVQLAGNRVIASFGSKIWSYALDGSGGVLLDDKLVTSYVLPSPDGRYLVATGSDEGYPTSVSTFDLESGKRLFHVDLLDEFPDWQGEPHPVRWLTTDTVLIGGLCHCDGPGGGFFDVVVSAGGGATRAPADLPPPAPRSAVITDQFAPGCQLVGYAGGRTIALVDAARGDVLAEARASAPVFLSYELSPDGTEVLVVSLDADQPLRDRLNELLASGRCSDDGGIDWSTTGRTLGLLRAGGDALEVVDSRLAVLDRWYPDQLPVFVCDGEERAGANTTPWLHPALWRSPVGFGTPWGFTSEACQDNRTTVIDMRVGTTVVDTAAEGYRVLAFLDSTRTSEN